MKPKHLVILTIVALVIVFLMGFRICDGCGISAKENFTFAYTFVTCDRCTQKREMEEQLRNAESAWREWRAKEAKEKNKSQTNQRIEILKTALTVYHNENTYLPFTLEQLNDSINTEDAWGNPIQYKKLSCNLYELRSSGSDGILGTTDDIMETVTLAEVVKTSTDDYVSRVAVSKNTDQTVHSEIEKVHEITTKKSISSGEKLSKEDINRLLNAGAKPSDHTSVSTSEDERVFAIMKNVFTVEFNRFSASAQQGLQPAVVTISLDHFGNITNRCLTTSSKSASLDDAALNAAQAVRAIPNLPTGFTTRYPSISIPFRLAQ